MTDRRKVVIILSSSRAKKLSPANCLMANWTMPLKVTH